MVLSVPLIAGWLYTVTNANFQQGLGFVIHVVGILLQGPSLIFGSSIPKSATQIFVAMSLTGLGTAFALPMQSYFMLRIVWENAGVTKEDVGGSIASGQLFFGMLAGVVAPPIGGALYRAIGFPGLTTVYGLFFAAMYATLFVRLFPYGKTPPWVAQAEEQRAGTLHPREPEHGGKDKQLTAASFL